MKILAISSKSQKFTNLSVIFNPFPFHLFYNFFYYQLLEIVQLTLLKRTKLHILNYQTTHIERIMN